MRGVALATVGLAALGLGACEPAAAAPCATGALDVRVEDAGAGAGHRYHTVTFTNRSTASCTITGPGAAALPTLTTLAADGRAVGEPARPDGVAVLPAPIVLAPGDRARASVDHVVAELFDPAACGAVVPVATLAVAPPSDRATVSLPFATTRCSNAVDDLRVRPLEAGAGESLMVT